MLRRYIAIVSSALFIIGFFGCARNSAYHAESKVNKNWGRSFESARYHQTLYPEAAKNQEQVVGLDGIVVERVMRNYVQGYADKKDTPSEFGILTNKK